VSCSTMNAKRPPQRTGSALTPGSPSVASQYGMC
jgi:hypothetical protein